MLVAKNDKIVLIRTGQLGDANTILDIQRDVVAENEYLISVPDEFDKTTEQQRNWVQEMLEKDRETIIVAEISGKVVGWLAFQSQSLKRLSHTGFFGMMIHKDYRGMGIGKMLIKEVLNWAEKNPLIEKISLGVFSTNHSAIALYKSVGFIEEGRKIKEIKINDSTFAD